MKFIFDIYYKKTKGNYPFFEFCPDEYKEHFLQKRYVDAIGKEIDLKNPKTFNEKVRWLINNEKLDLKTKFADKLQAKKYVKENIGKEYVAELYGDWAKFSDIDFNTLPNAFALKMNHGWRMNAFIHNKDMAIKNKYDKLKKTFDDWMQTNFEYASLEPQYKNIEHKIYAEELISADSTNRYGQFLIHCFNGEPKFIEITPPIRQAEQDINSTPVYSVDWVLQPFHISKKTAFREVERPEYMDKILEISKILSKDFAYVRVDFLPHKNSFVFAEMTFSPYAAFAKFVPQNYDDIIGDMIKLPDFKAND